MLRRILHKYLDIDLSSSAGRALIEERYWSLRRQVPIVYLLGLVNLSAMELATVGHLRAGLNVPSFIAACGIIRLMHWFGGKKEVTHRIMVKRMTQTLLFAAAVCVAVCARCLYLLGTGDIASHMAVMLFGGLTAIGVAYGLTALPAAGRIPLFLIIAPISVVALLSTEPHFAGAAFSLVVVAALTSRLLNSHSRHFTDVIRSRAAIAHEQQQVESARQEAVIAATTDFLTGLPNRRAFVAALDAAAACGIGKHPRSFAVAILDLDRFKPVNDTFGHAVGDRILQEVANRLVRVVGASGLVARLGGDEFGILLPSIGRPGEAQLRGQAIVEAVNGPVSIDGRQFVISACVGLGLSRRQRDCSPSRVMADADIALYQAKESPIAGAAVFEQRMEAPRLRRTQIENALLMPSRDNFRVVFQPIFNLKSGRAIAYEALARWTDAELGPISPAEFVPIAEQLNLIDDINNHLMALAFEQARGWPSEIKLSFNLSAVQLSTHGSARTILQALKGAGLSPRGLQVEVTETALLADFARARENLAMLRKAGATIVLDDFGAGYASIGYLREIRFDQIKLDGALVTAAQGSSDGKRLLQAVINLCEILGVESIAEHVESEEILKLVVELGCTAGQGFWLKRPLPIEDLAITPEIGSFEMRQSVRRAA